MTTTTPARWVVLRSRARRGAAMLLALAALVIVVPAGVAALRSAAARALASSASLDEERARVAALSIGPALLAWAANQDGSQTAPLRRRDGLVRILDREGQDGARIVVDAIDLSGRLHVEALGTLARSGLPRPLDQMTVPAPTRREATSADPIPLMPEAIAWSVRRELDATAPTFPLSGAGNADSLEPAVALWVTDHGRRQNAGARARPGQTPTIPALNIHTAPIELLRAALVGYDPAPARSALECRERGEPIPPEVAGSLAAASRAGGRGAGESGRSWSLTPLTTRSDAYGFLVAVERGATRVTWWIVAERSMQAARRGSMTSAGRGPASGWTITERRRVFP
ncbi:MAG: hypothetical protein IBJ10_08130 [Phycisphaerales bacterium]|nr:hypothetical protein [Phycisphaerales bacterium]